MDDGIYSERPEFRSRLSFLPLFRTWQQISEKEKGIPAKICGQLVKKFSRHKELMEVIDDYSTLDKHRLLIEEAMSTIFPASLSSPHLLNAVAVPFSYQIIHASPLFRHAFMDESQQYMQPLDRQVEDNIFRAKIQLAYKLILKTFYKIDLSGGDSFICAYPDPAQNIHNYFELVWDPQFIDVETTIPLPSLPKEIALKCHRVNDLFHFPEFRNILPLDEFIFDGLIIIYIKEVTERETFHKIKEILQAEKALKDKNLLASFKDQLAYLIRREEAHIGLFVFNSHYQPMLTPDSSVLFNHIKAKEKEDLKKALYSELQTMPYYMWHDDDQAGNVIGRQLKKEGWKNVLLSALYHHNELAGCLEICSRADAPIGGINIGKVEGVVALLQNAFQKNSQYLQNEVNRLVKEHFTAVQSSVEWKFNQTVIDYLEKLQQGGQPEMQPIEFNNVYPLYASIDVRNSSGERNHAVQQDMTLQLEWIKKILFMAQEEHHLPFVDEVLMRLDEYIASISQFLFATDEQAIQDFLKWEAAELLRAIQDDSSPLIGQEIEAYFQALHKTLLTINTHQQQFEASLATINNHITHLLQREQQEAQLIYPHYFERFVTDGVEMNIFIGQSIAPHRKFHKLYLRNMQLWLLTLLAHAAQLTNKLLPQLPVPLTTAQLILLTRDPISIQFRTEERKFDVEGMYNVHYEIVKKRIDKALIKGTNERLTQPGTIAIVYSGNKEAKEFMQHIEFLKRKQFLEGDTELLKLEEMQGVSGLKALRVKVRDEG